MAARENAALAKLEAEKSDITSKIRELQQNIKTARNKAASMKAAISDTGS